MLKGRKTNRRKGVGPTSKRKKRPPRPHVMAAYLKSHEKFGPLYKKLAG